MDYRRILVANTNIVSLRAHTKSSSCGGHLAGCCRGYGLFFMYHGLGALHPEKFGKGDE